MRRGCLFLLILTVSYLLIYCGDSSPSSPTTTTSATTTSTSSTTTSVIENPIVIRETGEQFSTIQEAINAASPGQHIDVPTGNYEEHLQIDKQVYLTGEDMNTTKIYGFVPKTPVVHFVSGSEGSEIREFTIRNGDHNGISCHYTSVAIGRVIVRNNEENGIDLFDAPGEISGVIVKGNGSHGITISFCISLMVKETVIEENHVGIICVSETPVVTSCTISNNENEGVWCEILANPDFGGGAGGSPGYNVIRNNGYWDFYNLSHMYDIKAENNYWDHNTAGEIDEYDIYDDDEYNAYYYYRNTAVDFEPFLTGEPTASLRINPRLLSASSLFKDFFRSLFRTDIPASTMYLSSSFEPKLHIAHFNLMRARYRPLTDKRYYPPLMMRNGR
jgi:hypothetical protein